MVHAIMSTIALQVYDASAPAATFSFIKQLRDQMFESRDMTNVPVVVVANKMDVVADKSFNINQMQQSHQQWHGETNSNSNIVQQQYLTVQ